MAKNNNRFYNIYFDRFVNAVMSEPVKPEAFKLLTEWDRQALARREQFIDDAGLEDKLLILSKLGIPFVIVAGAPMEKKMTRHYLDRLVSLFFRLLTFKKKLVIKMLTDKKLFVMADLDFIKGLKLASNLYNSPASTTFAGYRSALDRIYKYNFDSQKNAVKDAAAGHDLDGIIMTALLVSHMKPSAEGFQNLYGITTRQFIILATLSRQREVSLATLTRLTQGIRWASNDLTVLLSTGLIERHRVQEEFDSDFHYWLTGMGEQVLIKARNYFIHTYERYYQHTRCHDRGHRT